MPRTARCRAPTPEFTPTTTFTARSGPPSPFFSTIASNGGPRQLKRRAFCIDRHHLLGKRRLNDVPTSAADGAGNRRAYAIACGARVSWIFTDIHDQVNVFVAAQRGDVETLRSLIESERVPSMILWGPAGTGKTTIARCIADTTGSRFVEINATSSSVNECKKLFQEASNDLALTGRRTIIFCDEINLPATDKYGTQRVISFIRQLVESGGFYRTTDMAWVKLERIQFVGACNPPTDPGRVPLSHRFLRHAPLVMVDYPGELSLKQIYGTYNRAMLKVVPNLRAYSEPLTDAMVQFYLASQRRFTSDTQAHHIHSPRELT